MEIRVDEQEMEHGWNCWDRNGNIVKKYFPAFLLNFRRNNGKRLWNEPLLKNLTNNLSGE